MQRLEHYIGVLLMVNAEPTSTWIHCPICTRKTRTKINMDTVLINYPLYCPKCKHECIINVVQQRMIVIQDLGT